MTMNCTGAGVVELEVVAGVVVEVVDGGVLVDEVASEAVDVVTAASVLSVCGKNQCV